MPLRSIEAGPLTPSWEHFVQPEDGFLSGRQIAALARQNLAFAIQVVTDYAGQIPERSRPTTLNGLLALVDWEKPEDREQFSEDVIKLQEQRQETAPSDI